MKVKTKKPSGSWLKRARDQGFTAKKGNIEHVPLKKILLEIGGWGVCINGLEPDLDKIVSRGVRFPAKSVMMKGEPCQCHSNSALCWESNKERCRICTGYALSRDGMWRQHSWVLDLHREIVVETTEKRVAYWGFVLDEDECENFLFSNCY